MRAENVQALKLILEVQIQAEGNNCTRFRHYCRYLDDREYFENPEEEFLHFLRKMEGPGWKWTKECNYSSIKALCGKSISIVL